MLKIQFFRSLVIATTLSATPMPASAQIRTVDPNDAIDADLAPVPQGEQNREATPDGLPVNGNPPPPASTPASAPAAPANAAAAQPATYERGDLIGAAEGVFGRGAEGLASLIEKILKDQGEPNAYITGEEAAGAFIVGLRYGSGTLHHKVEGSRPVYWTGPSVGFDVGGNAAKSFVLVYNLYDSQDLYKRYPQGEGAGYFVGGFTASYLRRGDIVLIPIRVGAGLRLGANIGYMKFSEKGRWLPF